MTDRKLVEFEWAIRRLGVDLPDNWDERTIETHTLIFNSISDLMLELEYRIDTLELKLAAIELERLLNAQEAR